MNLSTTSAYSFLALLASGALYPSASRAQAPSPAGASGRTTVEEVVVTAQRTAQNLQDVPISVTALQSGRLEAMSVGATGDLEQVVPGLVMNRKANAVQPFVRGIGSSSSTAESPVATYVDGVYFPTPVGATLDLPDVAQIEVLKGPQGTLFGRNATAGALNITTRSPTRTPELEASLGYGDYDTTTAKAYAGGPLTDTLTGGLSLYYNDQREGFGKNVTPLRTSEFRLGRTFATREKLLWRLNEDTEIQLGGVYSKYDGNLTSFAARPFVLHRIPSGPSAGQTFVNPSFYGATLDSPYDNKSNNETYGGHFRFETAVGSSAALINTAAFNQLDASSYTEVTMSPFVDTVLGSDFQDKTFTNELRLQSKTNSDNRWVVGLYYLDETTRDTRINFNSVFPPVTGLTNAETHTTSAAAFADGAYAFGNGFSVTGGLRYTADTRGVSDVFAVSAAGVVTPFGERTKRTSKLTYRIVGQWRPTDDVMAYLSQSTGYRAGIISTGAGGVAPPLDPEAVEMLEAGVKTELFDRRVRLNVAAFRSIYSNIVVQQTVTVNGFTSSRQTNAARARVVGVDVDLDARITDSLTLSAGASLLPTAEYTDYRNAQLTSRDDATGVVTTRVGDATGNRLLHAPETTVQLQALYEKAYSFGTINLAAGLMSRSEVYFNSDNRVSEAAITLFSASAKWTHPNDRYYLSIWGKNLSDERYLSDALLSGGVDITIPGPPRQVGVTVGFAL